MKNITFNLVIVLFILICSSCDQSVPHDHAQMLVDEKMNNSIDSSLQTVVRSPSETVISSQAVVKPVLSSSSYDHTAEGYVTIDPTRNENIASRFNGRIEKLYVRYDYQYVSKGEKIMEIYSPELKTAEEEYLFVLQTGMDTTVKRIAREKLLLMGMTNAQVQQLESTRKVMETIAVFSPYAGYVRSGVEQERPFAQNNQSGNSGTMQMGVSGSQSPAMQTQGEIREGSYVVKGQTLFVINDVNKVWVMLSTGVTSFPVGTPVKLCAQQLKDTTINASIGFVEPVFASGQKFTSYRIYVDNPKQTLLLNSLVSAQIASGTKQRLELPASSVLSLGERKIVWVRSGFTSGGAGIFEAREVTVNKLPGANIEITSGLTSDEEVALNAGFMVDSQSIINPN